MVATPALQFFALRAAAFESQCLAASTAAKYNDSVLYFVRWLLAIGVPLDPCWHQPTEGILRSFAAFLAATCSAETIRGHLHGLKHYLMSFGPVDWSNYTQLQRELKGIQRIKGVGQQQKLPITMEMLLLWVLDLSSSWASRVQCLVLACVFGVFGMLRCSNLVPGSSNVFGRKFLRRMDVVYMPELYALRLTLRETKTLQLRERQHVIYIAGCRGAVLDPVQLYLQYISSHPADAEDPMFMYWDDESVLAPLTFDGLATGIKDLVQAIGLNPADYATHSLRRGGASAALKSGLAPFFTMFQGDWHSDCYLRYYSISKRDMLRITAVMLQQLHNIMG